jgi:predicted small secreted protein
MLFKSIKIQLVLLSLVLLSVAVTGCNTMDDAVQAKGTGETVNYQASFDQMWAAIPEVIGALDLKLVSMDREKRMILARRGMTGWSYGEDVAIFVEEVGQGKCSVEVVSKKVMTTNVFAPNWANHIFKLLDNQFKRVWA